MAIEVNTHNIVALTTVMFNAAPGANNLAEFSNYSALEQLATNLAGTDAFNSQFPEGSPLSEDINQVLTQNLGIQEGTEAYAEAYNFFETKLTAGENAGSVLLEAGAYLLSGNADPKFANAVATLQNKIEVGTYYSVDAGRSAESLEELQSVVADVTAEQASVDAAIANIDAMPAESGGEGQTFTLTTGVDQFTGTNGDDIFLAPQAVEGGNSLNAFDQVDGGAGRDTLRVEGSQPITGDISSIETVRVEGDAAAEYDTTAVDGLEELRFVNTDDNVTVTGLTANQTVGFENSTTTGPDLAVASGSTVNVALADSTVQNLGYDEAGSNTVTTLNITSQGESTLSVSGQNEIGDDLRNVTVAASGELTIETSGTVGVSGETVTFDASASTGNITVTESGSTSGLFALQHVTNVIGGAGNDSFGALDSATSVDAGAGDDTIDLAGNDEDVTVNAGAGDDRILLGTQTLTGKSIDGGEGNDAVVLGGGTFTTQNYGAINELQNIETLEFSADGVIVDASELNASALTFTGANATVQNLGAEQTAIVSAGAEAATAASAQTLSVTGDIASTVNVEASYDASEEEANDNFSNTVTLNVADDDTEVTGETLNLSGNGNFVFYNGFDNASVEGVDANETFTTVDASELEGSLNFQNVAEVQETVILGADNGSDTLNLVNGSTYGNMDVIQNFDSSVDANDDVADEITGVTGAVVEVDVADATSLNAAFSTAAAADAAATGVFFQFEGNTYAFADQADGVVGEYDNADIAIQIVGTHDLSSDNAAYGA